LGRGLRFTFFVSRSLRRFLAEFGQLALNHSQPFFQKAFGLFQEGNPVLFGELVFPASETGSETPETGTKAPAAPATKAVTVRAVVMAATPAPEARAKTLVRAKTETLTPGTASLLRTLTPRALLLPPTGTVTVTLRTIALRALRTPILLRAVALGTASLRPITVALGTIPFRTVAIIAFRAVTLGALWTWSFGTRSLPWASAKSLGSARPKRAKPPAATPATPTRSIPLILITFFFWLSLILVHFKCSFPAFFITSCDISRLSNLDRVVLAQERLLVRV